MQLFINFYITLQATRLCACGWILGAVLSLPQLYVFHQNVPTEGRWKNMTLCESIFRDVPVTHRQAYLTYVALVVFYIPLVVILFCYLRIYLKIARKSEEGKSTGSGRKSSSSSKPGKIHLQSTTSNSLSKAKSKTLKMTVVIVFSFVVCNLPIHILEAIMSFGDHTLVSGQVMAILGATAVANSATNPFVFLLFNASQMQCLQLRAARKRDSQKATMSRRSGTTKSENQELRSCKTTCMSTDGGVPIEEDETTQVVPFVQDHPPRSNEGRHDLARIQGCATVLLVESDTEMMVVSGVD